MRVRARPTGIMGGDHGASRKRGAMSGERRRARPAPPRVSLLMPVHRDSSAFRQALEAVSLLDPQPDELVIAVDGPDDELAALALSRGARVVQLRDRRGPAVARNLAAKAARGDVLFYIDADVVVRPDVVGRVREHFRADPGLSAVIGSYDDDPAEPNFFSQYKNLLNHFVHQHAHREGTTFWGACGAVRSSVFSELGGFDPRYPRPTVEDIELGYRIVEAGGRIEVLRDLQVKHLKRWTARSLLTSDVWDRALPWSSLILRTGRVPNDLNVDTRGRASAALAAVALSALAVAPRRPAVLPVAPAAVAAMAVLDRPLLRFLAEHRGRGFAARSMAWHALYHGYSGASFAAAAGHQATGSPVYRWRAVQRRRDRARRRGLARPIPLPPYSPALGPDLVGSRRYVTDGPVPVLELEPASRTAAPLPAPRRRAGASR
jgi:glycosyltransferase involved in cell wall biosynthesis